MLNVTEASLSKCERGQAVQMYVDTKRFGLALSRRQIVLLGGVDFFSQLPPHLVGSFLGAGVLGEHGVNVHVHLKTGRVAVCLTPRIWHIDWSIAGYLPEKKGWYFIQPGTRMSPLLRAEHVLGIGPHLFVRNVG